MTTRKSANKHMTPSNYGPKHRKGKPQEVDENISSLGIILWIKQMLALEWNFLSDHNLLGIKHGLELI